MQWAVYSGKGGRGDAPKDFTSLLTSLYCFLKAASNIMLWELLSADIFLNNLLRVWLLYVAMISYKGEKGSFSLLGGWSRSKFVCQFFRSLQDRAAGHSGFHPVQYSVSLFPLNPVFFVSPTIKIICNFRITPCFNITYYSFLLWM